MDLFPLFVTHTEQHVNDSLAEGLGKGVLQAWRHRSCKGNEAQGLQDVADSLGITNLADEVSLALAADVEYRLREVVEVSQIFVIFLSV